MTHALRNSELDLAKRVPRPRIGSGFVGAVPEPVEATAGGAAGHTHSMDHGPAARAPRGALEALGPRAYARDRDEATFLSTDDADGLQSMSAHFFARSTEGDI